MTQLPEEVRSWPGGGDRRRHRRLLPAPRCLLAAAQPPALLLPSPVSRSPPAAPLLAAQVGWLYYRTFVRTMRREWVGIDRLRLDKFMLLIRKFFAAALRQLQACSWCVSPGWEAGWGSGRTVSCVPPCSCTPTAGCAARPCGSVYECAPPLLTARPLFHHLQAGAARGAAS